MTRRSVYEPEYCQALIKFFDIEPWEIKKTIHYDTKRDENGERIVLWVDEKRIYTRMPSLYKFAKKIKVSYRTLYYWFDENHTSYHEDFAEAWETARQIRKEWLIDVGLSGLSPSNSFKFVAVNCTDMSDKNETEHSGAITFTEALSGATGDGSKG